MALPAVLSGLVLSGVELADLALVGRWLGTDPQAAVGYAARLTNLAQALILAVGMGCVALMARAIGARDRAAAAQALAGAVVLGLGLAGTLCAVILAMPERVLGWLNASPAVSEHAVAYLSWSLPAMLFFSVSHMAESAHRARRDTLTPLAISGAAALLKIALNFALVPAAFVVAGVPFSGAGLAIEGAGLATFIAYGAAMIAYGIVGWLDLGLARGVRGSGPLLPRVTAAHRLSAGTRRTARLAWPVVVERVVMSLGLLVFFAFLGLYGSATTTAYAIGGQLLAFSWLPGIGCGIAANTLVGEALGARDREGAWRAARRSMGMGVAVMLAFAVVCAVFRDAISHLFTTDPAVIAELGTFCLVIAVAQPFMGVHFTLAGALRGAGDTLTPMYGATAGNWLVRVPLAWLAAWLGLPILFVWSALVGDHVLRATWFFLKFRGGAWAKAEGLALPR